MCFVGDPVVLVVAESRALAEDACELVNVEYEPRPAVIDLWLAVDDDNELVHEELESNVARSTTSPDDPALGEAFETAAHVVTDTIRQQRYIAVPMETRGAVASWDPGRGNMSIWISSQGAHGARDHFANILGLPVAKVHVIVPDVGGAFGQKINVGREETALALAARLLGRPVKWSEDRYENLVAAPHSRAEEAEVSIALDADGTFLAMQVEHIDDLGAYSAGGGGASILRFLPGPYKVGKVGGSSTSVITNTSRRGAYRGPWMFETIARELMIDIARAHHRHRSPRAAASQHRAAGRSAVHHHDRRDVRPGHAGGDAGAGGGDARLRRVPPRAGRGARRRASPRRGHRLLRGTHRRRFRRRHHRVDHHPHRPERLHPGDQRRELAGSQHGDDHRPGHRRVPRASSVDDVEVLFGDTAIAPMGATTGGSRNAVFGGGAARQAATRDARAGVPDRRAHARSVARRPRHGRWRGLGAGHAVGAEDAGRGRPSRVHDPEAAPAGVPPGLEIASRFTTDGPTWSNAAHICTCEVDPRTGLVTLLRYIVSEDCGALINPNVVEGQIAGGVVQGIGGALFEHFVYDDDGNPTTTTFLDYLLPTAADVAVMEYGHIQTASARPGGFKGMGEGGAIGAPAAVFNAVADALAPLGVVLTDQPLTPAALVQAISRAAHPLIL